VPRKQHGYTPIYQGHLVFDNLGYTCTISDFSSRCRHNVRIIDQLDSPKLASWYVESLAYLLYLFTLLMLFTLLTQYSTPPFSKKCQLSRPFDS
jgi:hypothetical protein